MKSTLCMSLLLAFCATVQAQEAPPPARPTPPPGPLLILHAPDFSSWVVTIKRPKPSDVSKASAGRGGSGHADAAIGETKQVIQISVTMTKTGKIREEVETDDQGHSEVKWYAGTMQVTKKSGWTSPVLSSAATNPFDELLTDYSKTDFPGFEWVSEKNYLGIKNVAGRDCLIFKDKASTVSADELKIRREMAVLSARGDAKAALRIDPEQFQKDAVACIDLETRLPVALQRADETRTYHFQDAPQTTLVLPPEMQAPIDLWNRQQMAEARPAARPY